MPLQATAGAATYDAFGGGPAVAANYIEDVFSTFLYTGNDLTQTITNGVDLAGKGGLVWLKNRTTGTTDHILTATPGKALRSNTTGAEQTTTRIDAFNSNGFFINNSSTDVNQSSNNYTSWTFRKQAKFFDVVTWTGDGVADRLISHNLGSAPGLIVVKRTDTTSDWKVHHAGTGFQLCLNLTDAANSSASLAGGYPGLGTTTTFRLFAQSGSLTAVNASGGTYVAYLFAHDAGGFGASGTDNVISCGSYTGNGSTGQLISLGYEPQWVLIKQTDAADQWAIIDNMRGWAQSDSATLCPNNSNAENATFSAAGATSLDPQGFRLWNANGALNESGGTYIYIAIRRGPMRTPTTGTSVYDPEGIVTVVSNPTIQTGFVTDMAIAKFNGVQEWLLNDRLRNAVLYPDTSNSEGSLYGTAGPGPFDVQNGYKITTLSGNYALWAFRRAPGFFDVVCYTGTGSARTVNHNLGVVPEMMIAKTRSLADSWYVYTASVGNQRTLYLDASNPQSNTSVSYWNNTTPTASVFTVGAPGGAGSANISGETYVAYLFATVAGVSKVGSYTGTGTTLQVNCGFTAGARFVLIKRTDSTGDWYVWDSARGIVAGNDPYLLLNSTAAEVTSTDYVDTYSAGFEISSTAPAAINANGGTFIFLAIA